MSAGPQSRLDRDLVPCGRPRAVATDYDGTLTEGDRPSDRVLTALAEVRDHGIAVVLVTGRLPDELRAVFPDVDDHFDALVLENGARIDLPGASTLVAPPIDPGLSDALSDRGITHRGGCVILAATAADEHAIVDAISDLGLECQLVRNRGELMVLPSGVNKGVGLRTALARLGISPHDAVAVGDAENDHSLLTSVELGVAVANAVAPLKAVADVVLDAGDGEGVVQLLEDVTGTSALWRRRRRSSLTIGHDTEGRPTTLPAHPSNVLITGGSGAGKSYLGGLVAEQLIDLEYSVLVVDPEGDHSSLDALRPAVVLGADGPPPSPDVVVSLLERSDACVVVDLSMLTPGGRRSYLAALPSAIEASRRALGRPHWVVLDEAHYTLAPTEAAMGSLDLTASGYCLITWRPGDLPRSVVAALDTVIALTGPELDDDTVDLVAAVSGHHRHDVAHRLIGPNGSCVVARRGGTAPLRAVRIAPRWTDHFRHENKYEIDGTSSDRAFWFRGREGHPTGVVAHNLHELEQELARCDRDVIRHHAPLRDLSRWIDDVFHHGALAALVHRIESAVDPSDPAVAIDIARLELIRTLQRRRRTRDDPVGGQRRVGSIGAPQPSD